jgi:hypothetical protein
MAASTNASPPNTTNMVAPRRHDRILSPTTSANGWTVTYAAPGITSCSARRTASPRDAAFPLTRIASVMNDGNLACVVGRYRYKPESLPSSAARISSATPTTEAHGDDAPRSLRH